MIEAIHEKSGMVYTHGTSIGYATAGTSRDWFYSDDATDTGQLASPSS
jgi:hypothetical protein